MGIHWLLVATCIACCVALIHCDDLQQDPNEAAAVNFVRTLLFGYKPCLDENCESVPPVESPKSGIYEQPKGEMIPTDKVPQPPMKEVCLILETNSVHEYRDIEIFQPGFSEVRNRLLEEIISYARAYSLFYDPKCSVEMKFLDLFILAASELRKEYLKMRGGNCSYTFVEGSEWPVLPDSTVPCELNTTVSVPPTPVPTEVSSRKPYPTVKGPAVTPTTETAPVSTPAPSPEESGDEVTIIAEEDVYAPVIGSVRGIPGVHYPNYTDVPITSFSCADKHMSGFYADLETGCQVFHVCYEHRRESFLCPIGTIFNQPILACDYWYSSNCSLAPAYFGVNVKPEKPEEEELHDVKEMISVIIHDSDGGKTKPDKSILEDISKFFPVKATVTKYPAAPKNKEDVKKPAVQEVGDIASEIFTKLVNAATNVASKTRDAIEKLPEPVVPEPQFQPTVKPKEVLKMKPISPAVPLAKVAAKAAAVKIAAPIFAKAKFAAATIPLASAKAAIPVAKLTAAKTALPILTKAKVAAAAVPAAKAIGTKAAIAPVIAKGKLAAVAGTAAKVAVPVVTKAKLAAAVPVAAKVAAKASIPPLKAKIIASAVPLAKTKLAAPALKAKALKAASIPLVKSKVLAVPLVKSKLAAAAPLVTAKLVKSVAISPLTKKALALGYMKLLKAKKLAVMG